MKTLFGVSVTVAFLYAFLFGVGPQAQDGEDEETPSDVSETEINMYIDVYSAMHADHGLKIEDALAARKVSLEQFRDIERRVQQQQRLVDRVREALLEKAKSRTTTLSALPAPQTKGEADKTPVGPAP